MKYMVIGAGGIGSTVAMDLAQCSETSAISVADINMAVAQEVAQSLGPKGTACEVDIYDAQGLVNAIEGHDVVLNLAGPYYQTAGPVLEACMAAKVNYVDVADDASAVVKLLGYEDACREAGITALVAFGASPGLSNVLCMLGASKMDEVDELYTLWVQSVLEDTTGAASIWHGLEMVSGTVPQFIDGKLQEVPAISGRVDVDFGSAMGEWPVYYVGHPEPVTLPNYIKGVKKVVNMGNLWPADADLVNLFGPYRDLGLCHTDTLRVGTTEVSKRDFACANIMDSFDKALAANTDESNPDEAGTQLRIDVIGRTGGFPDRISYAISGTAKNLTGWSASFAAQALAAGKIDSKGLFPPEAVANPDALLHYLGERGVQVIETKTETRTL
jgi:lysine 6-dehydrogenase